MPIKLPIRYALATEYTVLYTHTGTSHVLVHAAAECDTARWLGIHGFLDLGGAVGRDDVSHSLTIFCKWSG